MPLAPITDIIADFKAGRMVVLVDDEDRENEGDLIFAAAFVTAEKINFLAKNARGLVCMPITVEHAERLRLPPMTPRNRSVHGTNFTVSIEAAQGVSTGISAADRALTIRVARVRTTSCSQAMCSRSSRSRAACWHARVTRKRAAISRALQASRRSRCCARS